MTIARSKPIAECVSPREALGELSRGFSGAETLEFDCEEVTADSMPLRSRELLVHKKHMTRILQEHYGRPVSVHVVERHHAEPSYGRKIFLTLEETTRVVQYGLVRLDFRYMSTKVKTEILGEGIPLGAVLINHNVLRRIEPRWFLRFPAGSPVLAWFNGQSADPLYGRLGTIYCNHEPAIEVLEIVTGV